jgi:hypothetical protein
MISSTLSTEKTKMIKTSMGNISEKNFIKKANQGTLPENLIVKENLDLEGCKAITSLPKGLQVQGHLELNKCPSLTSLPEGLKVRGWLDLRKCPSLTALPSDTNVGIYIFVDDSFIQNYPFKDIPKILHLPFVERLKQLLLKRLK